MQQQTELISSAIQLLVKSVIISAKRAAVAMSRLNANFMNGSSDEASREILLLRHRVAELEGLVAILRGQLKAKTDRRRLTAKERLLVLWHMELFGIPKRRAAQYFGIASSTIYRWLSGFVEADKTGKEPGNKTPADVVDLVWNIVEANPTFGKLRVAQQLALLNIVVCASTVRNILNRPKPRDTAAKPKSPKAVPKTKDPVRITARHANDVWSGDLTVVKMWLFWPTYVFAVIDHFSRKVVAVVPLPDADTSSVIAALRTAFTRLGAPNQFVTDAGSVFTARDFKAFLGGWNIQHRIGALGEVGSVAVTERLNQTLKYEWLRRVHLIRGLVHLTSLCSDFIVWVNEWRPHQTLAGARPEDVYRGLNGAKPSSCQPVSTPKTVPTNMETIHFTDTRTTAWRLKRAA